MELIEDDKVEIHSLGPSCPGTYKGVICGKSVDYGDSPATIYIVKLVDLIDSSYRYSCACIPAACLRRLHQPKE